MRKTGSFREIPLLALLGVAMLGPGCGSGGYQSDEDFVNSIRQSSVTGEVDGTMPPVDQNMEDAVAKIRVETNELDVGVVPNDRLYRTQFKIYNDGKMPLKITRIDTTCACTQGLIPPEGGVVPPGGEGHIDIVIDPFRIPGFFSRKVLTITSTDPRNMMTEVGVTARVEPEYELDMDEINLGEIQKGATETRTIRFRQLQDNPITLSQLEPLTQGAANPKIPGIAGEIAPVPETDWQSPDKAEYDLVFTVGPDLPAGPFKRYVLLHTNVPRFQRHHFIFEGSVKAPYRVMPVYPERAMFKPEGPGGALRAQVTFFGEAAITLDNIRTDNPHVHAEPKPGSLSTEAILDITLKDLKPGEGIDDTIRVRVTLGDRAYEEIVGVRFGNPDDTSHGHAH
ncbi:MAG: DUF1573 domain-containing protein [Candidatus Hydrogenedentes bacterium]|nr:DUF1573 domain-containing protein [Candidatus Hydrogenedentota bacterium]